MKEVNLLMLGGGKRVSFVKHVKREALNSGIDLKVYSYELDYSAPISAESTIIIGKRWDDLTVIEDISHYINKLNINLILPFVDPATLIAADLKAIFNEKVVVPVSSRDVSSIFFNKEKASCWFNHNDIPHPKKSNTLPLILKPIFGSASKGIVFINNESELQLYGSLIESNDYICEQRIFGGEYTVDAYVLNRQLIYCVPRERLETSGGESIKTITLKDPVILKSVNQIVSKCDFNGPITLQLIKQYETGDIYFIEINPRLGGGVICSMGAGVNIPKILLDSVQGLSIEPIHDWTDRLMMSRYLSEVFINAVDN